jgi:hypothetical protein
MSEGLEQVAAQTRGSMTTVMGDGAAAFDRLGRELSGYYLIGFEPTDADRTGKERRIKVEVRPRGLTVRAPTFVIAMPPKHHPALTPQQQLGEVLDPLPVRACHAWPPTPPLTPAARRVVIAAEVSDPPPLRLNGRRRLILNKDERSFQPRRRRPSLRQRAANPRLVLSRRSTPAITLRSPRWTSGVTFTTPSTRGSSAHRRHERVGSILVPRRRPPNCRPRRRQR